MRKISATKGEYVLFNGFIILGLTLPILVLVGYIYYGLSFDDFVNSEWYMIFGFLCSIFTYMKTSLSEGKVIPKMNPNLSWLQNKIYSCSKDVKKKEWALMSSSQKKLVYLSIFQIVIVLVTISISNFTEVNWQLLNVIYTCFTIFSTLITYIIETVKNSPKLDYNKNEFENKLLMILGSDFKTKNIGGPYIITVQSKHMPGENIEFKFMQNDNIVTIVDNNNQLSFTVRRDVGKYVFGPKHYVLDDGEYEYM